MLSRRIDPRAGTVMVWGAVNAGQAANAIPQIGSLAGTVRTGSRDVWITLEDTVRDVIAGLLAPLRIDYTLNYRRGVPPVINEAESTHIFVRAIQDIALDALAETTQSGGGEDFSWYLEEVPGAMARLGVWSGSGRSSISTSPISISTNAPWGGGADAGQSRRAERNPEPGLTGSRADIT